MNNNLTNKNIEERKIEVQALREKLKQYFTKNTKFSIN